MPPEFDTASILLFAATVPENVPVAAVPFQKLKFVPEVENVVPEPVAVPFNAP